MERLKQGDQVVATRQVGVASIAVAKGDPVLEPAFG
jgi:hypothetical protein